MSLFRCARVTGPRGFASAKPCAATALRRAWAMVRVGTSSSCRTPPTFGLPVGRPAQRRGEERRRLRPGQVVQQGVVGGPRDVLFRQFQRTLTAEAEPDRGDACAVDLV